MKFAQEMRSVFQDKFPAALTAEELALELGVVPGERNRIASAIRDFVNRGEVEKTDIDGTPAYLYVKRPTAPNKKQVMWRLLRARRRVTIEDLQELAGVDEGYARRFLKNLEEMEITRKIHNHPNSPAIWQLVNDTIVEPETNKNAERLRLLRANRKAAKQLDLARASLTAVRISIDVALKELDDARREVEEGQKS